MSALHPPSQILELRDKIDEIDHALLDLVAKRFALTAEVGKIKRDHHMPPVDSKRERAKLEEITHVALEHNLDPELARSLITLLMSAAAANHKLLQTKPPHAQ